MTAYGVDNVKVVGSEGLIKGPSSRGGDFKEIGAGTAGGTILGLIFAHPFVGLTVGAAATTVDRMRRRGKDLTLPLGTDLNYQLTRELTISGEGLHTAAIVVSPPGHWAYFFRMSFPKLKHGPTENRVVNRPSRKRSLNRWS